jgi:hypothetical protein
VLLMFLRPNRDRKLRLCPSISSVGGDGKSSERDGRHCSGAYIRSCPIQNAKPTDRKNLAIDWRECQLDLAANLFISWGR